MDYNDSKTKAKHRKKIVEKSRELFTKNGITQTTIKEICESADIERQTFYNYFKNKEELADYIYIKHLEEFYEEGFNDDLFQTCTNGFEKLQKYFETTTDRYFEKPELTVFLVHYDYFNKKEPNFQLVSSIYKKYNIVSPFYYLEYGIEDGSIDIGKHDKNEVIFIITQSFGAFANRLIYRNFHKSKEQLMLQKERLASLYKIKLEFLKAKR